MLKLPAADPIQRLPFELQLHIFSYLGYGGAIQLCQVNRYYHKVVDPQRQPVNDKIAFIQMVQKWIRHNICYISAAKLDPPLPPKIKWGFNKFACYSCYRVRDYSAFATSQVRRKHSKGDANEGQPGYKRCCIDCSIANGLYRARSRVAVPKSLGMWQYMEVTTRKPEVESVLMFYCETCKGLKPVTADNPTCACEDCGSRSRSDSMYNRGRCAFGRCLICGQCTSYTMIRSEVGCRYCNGPICLACGSATDNGQWWCGRNCSQEGYAFCCSAAQTWSPIQPMAWLRAEYMRALRASGVNGDVFEEAGLEDDCLKLLSL